MKPTIALVGPGKVGSAIAQRLQQAGYPLASVISRRQERATEACRYIGCDVGVASSDLNSALKAELILLAVPDDQIVNLAGDLARQPQTLSGKTLIHFSGLHPASCMRAIQHPAAVLSIHPLLPFANRQIASEKLAGCPCALEGDSQGLDLGTQLIAAFNGRAFRIATEKKALYHAGACIASNFFVTLLAAARDLLVDSGVSADEAISLLLPLVQASVDNVSTLGPEQGLTGPIVRGDLGTVEQHLCSLLEQPELLGLYSLLAEHTVNLAEASKRLSDKTAEQMKNIIIYHSKNLSPH